MDTSALLAWLWEEEGAEAVSEALAGSVVSTVTLGELFRCAPHVDPDRFAVRLRALDVDIQPLTLRLAWLQAQVPNLVEFERDDRRTGQWRLEWGDRTVAALGLLRDLPVLTSDRTLTALGDPYRISLFR